MTEQMTADKIYPDMPPQPLYRWYGKDKREQQEHGTQFIRIWLRIMEDVTPYNTVGRGKHHDNYQYTA